MPKFPAPTYLQFPATRKQGGIFPAIEIIAGIIVLVRPLIGAYIVMAWLVCIALQLLIGGHYYDVAVRDLVMAVGAYTLAQLTKIQSENKR